MPRIAGVNIKEKKRIAIAVTYIYGIGNSLSKKILSEVKIDPNKKASELTQKEVNDLRDLIEKNYKIEGDLRRQVMINVKRLPVRGQRTKTNTRTVRGNVRKTMGSGRKPAASPT